MTMYQVEVVQEHVAMVYVVAESRDDAERAADRLVRQGALDAEYDSQLIAAFPVPESYNFDMGDEAWHIDSQSWEKIEW